MRSTHEFFYDDIASALMENRLAIFAGAGMSIPAGLEDWKGLLKEIAEAIGLSVHQEKDLIMLAQKNVDFVGSRSQINHTIINHLNKNSSITETHKILSRLPISKYWTTNFDNLIERSLDFHNIDYFVKHSVTQLPLQPKDNKVTIFKMNGDKNSPNETVILKEDFDKYTKERQGFVTTLNTHLLENTFIFIGISFSDPTISIILKKVKSQVKNAQRHHYYFLKKIDKNSCTSAENYTTKQSEQESFIKQLKKYSLLPILLDNYDEIPMILQEVENKLSQNILDKIDILPEKDKPYVINKALQLLPHNQHVLHYAAFFYHENREFEKSIECIRQHLKMYPKDSLKLNMLGAILHNNFQAYTEAEQYFRQAIAYDANFIIAYVSMGNNHYQLGNSYKAEEYYTKALQLAGTENRDCLGAEIGLGNIYRDKKKYFKAEEHYKSALKLGINDSLALSNLGLLYFKLNKLDESKIYFEKALSADPDSIQINLNYGIVLMEGMKEIDEARRYFEKAIRLDTNNYKGYSLSGIALQLQQQDTIGQRIKFETAIELNPTDSNLYSHLAKSYENNWEKAKEFYEMAISLNSQSPVDYYNLGIIYYKLDKDVKKAKHFFEKSIDKGSKDITPYINLAFILYNDLHDPEEASKICNIAISKFPDDSIFYNFLGCIYYHTGFFDNAIKNLEIALSYFNETNNAIPKAEIETDLGNAYFSRALQYKELGDYYKARSNMELALKYIPDDPIFRHDYATILFCLNDFNPAIKELKRADKLDPHNVEIIWKIAYYYYKIKKIKESEKYYNLALKIDPGHKLSNEGLSILKSS